MSEIKVFGIGFHKTGTTSLKKALSILGFRVTGPNGVRDPNIVADVYPMVDKLSKEYNAFRDNPWPLVYRRMDGLYPGSKFILTVRPTDDWIKSQIQHFGTQKTPMREWIYGIGCPEGNEATYCARYERHNQEVLEYFKKRPDDLLVFRITEGEGWETLCPFLEKGIPDEPFPFLNRATHNS